MAWHTADWVRFFVNLLRFIFSFLQEEVDHEETNGGGPMTSIRDGDVEKKA